MKNIEIYCVTNKPIKFLENFNYKLCAVGKNNFSPPPEIDSVILKIIKKNTMSKELIQTINKIFSYRRKTVKNILKQFHKETLMDKRVDDLSGEEIINLANQILEK